MNSLRRALGIPNDLKFKLVDVSLLLSRLGHDIMRLDESATNQYDEDTWLEGVRDEPAWVMDGLFLGGFRHGIACMREILISVTTKLISNYRRIDPANPQLGSQELIILMMQSILYVRHGHPYPMKIIDYLNEILKCPAHLASLIQANIIEQIHELSTPVNYAFSRSRENWADKLLQCFFYVTNSEPAHGSFEHALMKGDKNMRTQAALVIPYIVK
nr:uncharacterized protein LOC111514137 [Leptinotarsa decemlineata]